VNFDQYKNLQYNTERSHSLEDFNRKIAPYRLESLIREILERNILAGEKTRVLELGTGNGRVLMELKKLFPEIEFYGINKEKTHTFYRRESYILTALKFGIFNKDELENIDLPYIVFQDLDFGSEIPYGDSKFDLIYSQNTLEHIKYKFELFNSILRVLRPGGLSFHSDMNGMNIYSKGVLIDLRDAFAEVRKRGLEVNTLEEKTSVRFKKRAVTDSFPLIPHQEIPENLSTLSQEMRRPEMSYNIDG
jgi:SAM-dependent methyltransferase